MNFVAKYDILNVPGDNDILITPVGLYDNEELLRLIVFEEFGRLEHDPDRETQGVLFSYAGTMYEYRWLEDRWVLAVHGGGEYLFTLLCADSSAWVEDLLVIAQGTNSYPTWPVMNP